MLDPERTLRQLVGQLEAEVRDQESELAEFDRRAEIYRASLKDDILRNKERIERFRNEMDAMNTKKRASAPSITSTNIALEEQLKLETQSDRIREAAKRILSASNRPLMQSEIKAQMDDMGVVIIAKNVVELIRAALRRNPTEFRHVKGEGWELR